MGWSASVGWTTCLAKNSKQQYEDFQLWSPITAGVGGPGVVSTIVAKGVVTMSLIDVILSCSRYLPAMRD